MMGSEEQIIGMLVALTDKLDKMDQRLDKLEQRLDKLEQRIDKLEQRLEHRIDKLEIWLMKLEVGLTKLEESQRKLEESQHRLEMRMDKLEERQGRLEEGFKKLEADHVDIKNSFVAFEIEYGHKMDALLDSYTSLYQIGSVIGSDIAAMKLEQEKQEMHIKWLSTDKVLEKAKTG